MDSSGMGFALSHMAKFGWKEGKGLGREETGMKEAIKVKLKFDSTGFGHDRAEEFKFQWWDHVFNKAAENISVAKNEKGGIELQRKEELVVSKSRPSVSAALMKEKLYGSFVKGATLHGSEEVSTADSSDDESDDDDEPRDMSSKLSDDQLFKLCGGKTAHKGARHGLNMSAKLERIRQQEEELMRKWKVEAQQDSPLLKSASSNEVQDFGSSTPNTKKNKKSKSKEAATEVLIDSGCVEKEGNETETCDSKKKKKKSKKLYEDEINDNSVINESEDVSNVKKKKKKKQIKTFEDSSFSDKDYEETKKKRKHTGVDNNGERKKIKSLIDQDTMTDSGIESVEHEIKDNGENLRKKKKHKNKEGNEGIQECESKLHMNDLEYKIEGQCKKKKSKKHYDESEKLTSGICLDSPDTVLEKKKKSKKKNKEIVSGAGKNYKENELVIDESDILSTVNKTKKKKKRKNEQLICSTEEEVEVKIQKKKKKKSTN